MKSETGKGISFIGFVIYIMACYGFLRTIAQMSGMLFNGREQYILAVAVIGIAGLLLIYLPLCILALKANAASWIIHEPGKMNGGDRIVLVVFLVLLIALRFFMQPKSLAGVVPDHFYRNLIFQGLGLIFLYHGMKRLGNSLIAVFSAAGVLVLPSFSNSVYMQEYQSLFFAVFAVMLAFGSMVCRGHFIWVLLYWMICGVLGWLQTDTRLHTQMHSATLAEHGMILFFYLIVVVSCLADREERRQMLCLYGIPFGFLFLMYAIKKTPIQEQGLFHIFLGAAAGEGVSRVLTKGSDEIVQEPVMKAEDRKEEIMQPIKNEKKKPLPGEYLDNPLPVPKRHVKKEMEYGFEPDPDKLFYDIPVSDEDDFDLK